MPTPLAEIHALVRRHDRPWLMIRQRYGLDNEPQRTLEAVATLHGITRERVRQLISRSLPGGESRWPQPPPPALPSCAAAWDVLHQFGGVVPLQLWHDTLPEPIRGTSPAELRIILLAHTIAGGLPTSWCTFAGIEWVVAERRSPEKMKLAVRMVRTSLRRGVARFAVPPAMPAFNPAERTIATALIASSGEWCETPSGWIIADPDRRPHQCASVRYLLTVFGPLAIDTIRRGLSRTVILVRRERKAMQVPSTEAMREILLAAGFALDGDTVSLGDRPPRPVRSRGILAFLELIRAEGPVLDRDRIFEVLVARGASTAAVANMLAFSPLVARRGRGLYALRPDEDPSIPEGGRPDRGAIRRRRRLIAGRTDDDGTIVLRYDITDPEARERYPTTSEIRIPKGTWWLALGRNAAHPIDVRRDHLRGLAPAVERARARRATALELRFAPGDSEVREVTAWAVRGEAVDRI